MNSAIKHNMEIIIRSSLIKQPSFDIWSYGVMVSTLDFESSDPSSNLGRT